MFFHTYMIVLFCPMLVQDVAFFSRNFLTFFRGILQIYSFQSLSGKCSYQHDQHVARSCAGIYEEPNELILIKRLLSVDTCVLQHYFSILVYRDR